MLQTISITVQGRVQGVFYRQSAQEKATALGITGTVRNLPDRSVYIVATGTKQQLDSLLAWCRFGPPRAAVKSAVSKDEALQLFSDFSVIR